MSLKITREKIKILLLIKLKKSQDKMFLIVTSAGCALPAVLSQITWITPPTRSCALFNSVLLMNTKFKDYLDLFDMLAVLNTLSKRD